MKKLFLFALLISVCFQFQKANAVEKGDLVIQPNLNLGNYYISGGLRGSRGFGIGVTGNVDYAVHEYVSVGGFVGFNHVNLKYGGSYGRVGIGARGVFHFWQLVDDKAQKDLKSDKVDWYIPLHLGYNFYTGDASDASGDVLWGLGMGIRYYFNDKIGIGFEFGGMELSPAKIGVAIKL